MKLILIGFAGSGKSSVAAELSKRLKLRLVEMDQEILARSGRESINQIFDLDGEGKFRELESSFSAEVSSQDNLIISTGGGVVTRAANIKNLRGDNGKLFYLSASFKSITERLKGDSSRPLFRDKVLAQELYSKRVPLYQSYADYLIDVEEKSVVDIAQEIQTILKESK